MKITKHEHAFLDVEVDGSHLLIDPGNMTDTVDVPNVVAVVITHEHDDHVDAANLQAIRAANPGVQIFADTAVVAKVAPVPVEAVAVGDSRQVGSFEIEFVGGKHALIHSSVPRIANLGVIVNGTLYHPGDSFALPGRRVEVAAVPTSGPWMKLGDAMDYLTEVDAPVNFAIHDALNSELARALADRHLGTVARRADHDFYTLAIGESLEV